MPVSKARLLAGAVSLIYSVHGHAHAQDAGGAQASGSEASSAATDAPIQAEPGTTTSAGIEDIIVTARRRAENIQTVPVAVTAITDSMLREKSITTPYDLVQSTPGIVATTGSSQRNDVIYFVRGQGATFGSSPAVVTYFADVPQQTNSASGGSNITFYDLESVQVLKGPQGTLFGRSTTGGAVLVTPKRPTGEFDGFAEASIGNYGARQFTVAVNVPILGDKLAVRVAGNYDRHEGYAKSLTTGEDLDDRDRSSYRISVLAKPTDWLTNTAIFSDVNVKENGTAAVLWQYEPNGIARLITDPRLPGGFAVSGSLLDTTPGDLGTGGLGFITVAGLCNTPALAGYLASIGQTPGQCVTQRTGIIDQVRQGLDAEYARQQAGGSLRRLPTTYDNFIRSRVQQIINTTEVDFGHVGFLGELKFKNIFSTTRNLHSEAVRELGGGVGSAIVFNDLDFVNTSCVGASPDPMLAGRCTGLGQVIDYGGGRSDWFDTWSEEAQFSGRLNDRHDWIIGFFKESTNKNEYLNQPGGIQILGGALTIPAGLPATGAYYDHYHLSQTGYFGQTTIDLAEFGVDGLRFTAGYRHSVVKNELTAVDAALSPAGISRAIDDPTTTADDPVNASLKQTADSYTFALDYRLGDRTMIYATTRRGFKQGGINILSIKAARNGVADAQPVFGPEKVTDYEVGIKTDYDLGSVAARTNLSLFAAKFSGLHRGTSFFDGQTTANQIINAAGLRSRGLELEQTLRFSPAFQASLSYAYLDAEFTEFPGVIVRPTTGEIIERIDFPVTGAPKHHLDLAARYNVDLGVDAGELAIAGNISYKSRTSIQDDSPFSLTPAEQKGYALANVRIDWNNVMGSPVDASLFVKNVTDTFYRIGSGGLISSQLGANTQIIGDPRTYGLQVRVRFGASGGRE